MLNIFILFTFIYPVQKYVQEIVVSIMKFLLKILLNY